MSSSSSDEEAIVTYYLYKKLVARKKQEKNHRRKFWIHPYIQRNNHCRLFVSARELQETDVKFIAFYRMSKESYKEIVDIISPAIYQKNTNMRECVSAEERILITLRYLAIGSTFVSLGLYFCRGESTVGQIVAETTQIIWNVMNGYWMSKPNKDQWENIAERYKLLWNLPNCIGSIDGKHIRIEKLPNTGSSNFNYKAYNSIVLLGCCDADGLFTMVETGYAGRNSDGGIFRASAMKYHITHSQLDIPLPSKLPHDTNDCNFPYYFVADEAFPLSKYLMRPYPRRTLNNIRRVFNYQLSRGRKTIECTFGMMTEKFQVLSTAIRCRDVDKINNIVKACCILHNFIRKREGTRYAMRNFEESNTTNFTTDYSTSNERTVNDQSSCYDLRDYLSQYFTTPQASLPWQWNYCI